MLRSVGFTSTSTETLIGSGNTLDGTQTNTLQVAGDELLTDGGGNIFNKFGTFMGNKDALGIGVAPSQILGGISAGLNLADLL